MIRTITLLLALALAAPALAQTAPVGSPPATPAAKPGAKSAAKPAVKKPAPAKGDAAAKPAAAAQPSGPCGIGVIPAIGDAVTVQRIGVMVFGNAFNEVPVPAWGLDDVVVARVRAAAGPRVNVRRIPYAKGAFESYDHPKSTLFRDVEAEAAGIVKKIAASAGCARYVVVTKGYTSFAGTNQTVKGIGLVNYGYGNGRTWVFAIAGIRVYDGASFAVLHNGFGKLKDDDMMSRLLGTKPVRGPSRALENFQWPEQPEAVVTPAVRDAVRELLAASLDPTLSEMLAQ